MVFETENQIMDLGNAQDLMDKPVSDLNITAIKSEVTVTPDGEFVVQGDVFSSQSELPTLGIEYDESGNVRAVSVKRANGQPKMFEGDVAEDLAYQILLQQAQSESQVERVNQELDQDEEFQRDHDQYVNRKQKELDGETPGAATPVADEVSEEASVEPEPTPEPIEPRPVEPLEPRPITREELAKRQKEDDVFLPKEGGRTVFGIPVSSFKDFGNFIRRKGFSSRSFRTRSFRDLMEKQEGHMSYYNNLVDRTVRKVNKAFNKASKGLSKGQIAELNEAFDAAVRGDMNQPLTPELKALAVEMRAQIDGLSRELLALGGLPKELAETIEGNIGKYMRVSYRMFDDPNYKPNDFIRERARLVLRGQVEGAAQNLSQRTGEDVEAVIDRMIDTRLADIIATEQQSSAQGKGKFGSKDIGSLQPKKDIDPDIQAFMGLYTDPTLNYARTIQTLSNVVTNTRFLNEMYEAGTANGWMFDANDPNRSQQFSYKLAGDATKTLDPLGGMYTTPEIGAALEKAQQQYGTLNKTYRTLVASAKYSKTILSPVTHSVNLFGNVAFAVSNGHFDTSAGQNPFKVLGADINLVDDAKLVSYFDELVKRGLISQSPALNEIKSLFEDGNVQALLESRASASNITARQKVSNAIAKGKAVPEKAYQMEDDVWKVYGANNEINRYAKIYYGKSPDQLTDAELDRVMDTAVENVKNTYANYGRAPELIKSLRFAPIGNFVTFQAEAYRTQYNIFALAGKEIAEGKRTNNQEMVNAGTTRLAGAMGYNLFRRGMIEGTALMVGLGYAGFGDDAKREEIEQKEADLRRFLPFWSENSDVYWTNIEPGSMTYIDANAADPFGNIDRIKNAFLNGENLQEGLIDALMQTVAPFSDPEMVAQTGNNLYNGKKSSGAPLYTEGMTDAEKGEAIINEVYDLFKPGGITSIETLAKADNKIVTGILMSIGQRPYKIDFNEQFRYKAYDAGKIISDAKRLGYDKETNTWANEGNKQKYDEAIKNLSDDYMSAVRLGVPSESLIESMQKARINNDDRFIIRTLPPAIVVKPR